MTDTSKQDFSLVQPLKKQNCKLIVQPGWSNNPGAHFVDQHGILCRAGDAIGVNFAVYAPEASSVELCLFDENGEESRLAMAGPRKGIWHLLVRHITEQQTYGFRAAGRWSPNEGCRFNDNKLLVDPYAREIRGEVKWSPALYDYSGSDGRDSWQYNELDSHGCVPLSVVRDDYFDWQSVVRPGSLQKSGTSEDDIIYEAHVKGFTRLHPDVPEHMRGTYLGMCHPVVIDYLTSLGITTLELLPVTSFVSEARLENLGLSNYWGYNPLALMAPEPSYGLEDPVNELKTMVRELHRAGIRVVMDVVFNHTCEAGSDGPSLSFRGLAEKEYYLLDNHQGQMTTANYSGCGNSVNFDSPQTLKLVMDSLRHWYENYQIDGFRFDLAPSMARRNRHFDLGSAFFQAVFQDPVLSQCQMIAEPWDLGPDGYRLTGFPRDWQEWNDRYRDGIRSFWRGDQHTLVDLAWRMSGSRDLFGDDRPVGSLNYICSHDGFTSYDLVSYTKRHNLGNGEDNRDGDQHNRSWNSGVEGATNDRNILARRFRSVKNMMATLMLSKSTPMFMAGDEFGNSQQGNNNAYCQDNDISWIDWSWLQESNDSDRKKLQLFMTGLIQLRQQHPVLTVPNHMTTDRDKKPAQEWFSHHGLPLTPEMLPEESGHTLAIRYQTPVGDQPSLMVMINNEQETRRFAFPDYSHHIHWYRILATAESDEFSREVILNQGWYDVPANSVVVIEEKR